MVMMVLMTQNSLFILVEAKSEKIYITNQVRKEGNVLFNDALSTHMVKDHSDSEREIPLPPHGYSFRLAARVF